jgi:hypothetical protein
MSVRRSVEGGYTVGGSKTSEGLVVLPQPSTPHRHVPGLLTESLIRLAETPDESSRIDDQLVGIAQLTVDVVAAVSYASVTACRLGGFTTVAANSDVALAVDQAQYADQSGPCLLAFDDGAPIAVPDIAATMIWPGFRDTAYSLGLRASLSIPLFAGRGCPIAALNLYGRDPDTMAPLTAAVWAVCDANGPGNTFEGYAVDRGGAALIAGLVGAFAVQTVIQRAIGAVIADTHRTVDAAYLVLRLRAAETGVTLTDAASAVLAGQQD